MNRNVAARTTVSYILFVLLIKGMTTHTLFLDAFICLYHTEVVPKYSSNILPGIGQEEAAAVASSKRQEATTHHHAEIQMEQGVYRRHPTNYVSPVHKSRPLVRLEHRDVTPERYHDRKGHEEQQEARHVQAVELAPLLREVLDDPARRQPAASVDWHFHHKAQEHQDMEQERGHEDARGSDSVIVCWSWHSILILVKVLLLLMGKWVAVGVVAAVARAPPLLLSPLSSKDPDNRDQAHEGGRRYDTHGQEAYQQGAFLSHVAGV